MFHDHACSVVYCIQLKNCTRTLAFYESVCAQEIAEHLILI